MSHFLANGLLNAITRCKVALATLKPKRTMLQIQGQAGDVQQTVELLAPYGFSMMPGPGADCLLLRISGRAEGGVAIMADDTSLRIADLAGTEFGLNDARGSRIVFRTTMLEISGIQPLQINIGTIVLGGLLGSGKKVALDGDPVVDGVVVSSATATFAN